jgi:hypothetical protein
MQSIASPYGHSKLPLAEGEGVATLKLPISFSSADAAVLFTVPAGHFLRINRVYWNVQAAFTGGSSSAIGLSSSNAGFSTKGDLIGGASGDVAATLTAGVKGGTLGAKFASNGVIVLAPGDTIRFDRIASAFTAGSGYAMVEVVEVGESLV